jgi:hypothetical protein
MNEGKEPAIKLSREISYGSIMQAMVIIIMIGGFLVTDHSSIVGLTERIGNVEKGIENIRTERAHDRDAQERFAGEMRSRIEKVQELITDGMRTASHK